MLTHVRPLLWMIRISKLAFNKNVHIVITKNMNWIKIKFNRSKVMNN